MESVNEIYELLGRSPAEAEKKASGLLLSAISQEEKDAINWARAYALVELKKWSEASEIWQGIYDRTQDHKSLHQIGMVYRESGEVQKALDIFTQEKLLISASDNLALAINFYELSYCHLLLGQLNSAQSFLSLYEALNLDESDLIERGCFFRLKGDIAKIQDHKVARRFYEQSLSFFQAASDPISSIEIVKRLQELPLHKKGL